MAASKKAKRWFLVVDKHLGTVYSNPDPVAEQDVSEAVQCAIDDGAEEESLVLYEVVAEHVPVVRTVQYGVGNCAAKFG